MSKLREDRRGRTRVACALTARYRVGEHWHAAAVLDLSERGCRLRVGEDLPYGAPLRVRFDAPESAAGAGATMEVAASVTWCRPQGLSRQAGLQFAAPPPGLDALLAPPDR